MTQMDCAEIVGQNKIHRPFGSGISQRLSGIHRLAPWKAPFGLCICDKFGVAIVQCG